MESLVGGGKLRRRLLVAARAVIRRRADQLHVQALLQGVEGVGRGAAEASAEEAAQRAVCLRRRTRQTRGEQGIGAGIKI
jgi:hypothetical protein